MIGIIDSGVGGLSVVKEMQKQNFMSDFVYLGDGANVPYGVKTPEEIIALSLSLVDFLVNEYQITSLVIACNTIVSAAYDEIKKAFPSLPIENIVAHGAMSSLLSFNDDVTVLATKATVESKVYTKMIQGLDENIAVHEKSASDLVMLVESNEDATSQVRKSIANISPNTDVLILGCTHFPFLYDTIREELKNDIQIIDPAYSCVQHLKLTMDVTPKSNHYTQLFLTTGDEQQFVNFLENQTINYEKNAIQKVVV